MEGHEMPKPTGAGDKRERIRKQFWPKEDPWTGENEVGWFRAPRTLPLVLALLRSKRISEKKDASSVYLELLARHVSGGVIEMGHESDHAYAAGYEGSRAVRTWQERMRILEESGFIRTQKVGNRRYRYVLVVHPTLAVQRLHDDGRIPDAWWQAYVDRKITTKEPTYEQHERRRRAAGKVKVIPLTVRVSPQAGKLAKSK
jgi:hypothetical protein